MMRIQPFIKVCTLCLFLVNCKSKNEGAVTAVAAITVVAQPVTRHNAAPSITLSGNVEGERVAKLGFLVAGKINFIAIQEGGSLEAGQLLASLDPVNYQLALAVAEAGVTQVQDEYNRLKIMHDRHSLSDGDFEKAGNSLAQAKAQRDVYKRNIIDTRLYTPFAGVLLKKNTDIGEIIGVGMPLFVFSSIEKVKVNAGIPESELHHVRIGQMARVHIDAIDSSFSGRITEIGAAADPTTRAFNVKIEFKNPRHLLKPGMIADVTIPSTVSDSLLSLPLEAILHNTDNNSTYVFVTDSTGKKAFKRLVTLGNLLGNYIEITSGLTEGEKVVTGGQQKLQDGNPINVE